ncbi:MAG: sulfatase [Pseudomonadota bacterium]
MPRVRPRLRLTLWLLAALAMIGAGVALAWAWQRRPARSSRQAASTLPEVDPARVRRAMAHAPAMPLDLADTDVLVAMVCTFRRDRLQPYGQQRPTSPFLQLMAEHGVLFEHAVVQSPWTRPSTGSLVTGRWARVLQLDSPGPESFQNRALAESATTLAERLHERGYRTIGASGNPNISSTFGFRQGFDTWHEPAVLWRDAEGPPPSGDLLVDAIIADLDATEEGQRVYLQAFFVDTHTPRRPSRQALRAVSARGAQSTRRVLVYDASLRTLDAHLAALFLAVQARRPNLLFVVVGDHGEGLKLPDNHGPGHGNHLYTTTTEVPFLWFHPSLPEPGRRIEGLAMGIDLVPTVMDLLEGAPPEGLDGASEAPALRGLSTSAVHDLAYSETWFRRADKIAVTGHGFHLIRDHAPKHGSGVPTEALYSSEEALEQTDVAAQEPGAMRTLTVALDAWEREVQAATDAAGPPVQGDPSAHDIEQLKTLGYLD